MARLLITGGAGFIGANFVHFWRARHADDRVVVLDALTYAGHRESLEGLDSDPQFRFVEGNVCDRTLVESLLQEENLDTLVHFAAETHVDRSIGGPDAFVETNVVGTQRLLEAARAVWLAGDGREHRFHHVSTDEVYGSLADDAAPAREDAPYRPNSPYAASKAASDHLVRAWHRTYGLQTTISNCTNNYGPYQYPEKLIPLMLLNLLHGRDLPVYGDGRHCRDWLHVSDHCAGIEGILARGRPGAVYNLSGREVRDNLTLVERLADAMDGRFAADPALAGRFPDAPAAQGRRSRESITLVADRPGHDRRYALDCGLAEDELGYTPGLNLEQGLEETVGWYLAHESWWRSVLDDDYRHWLRQQYGEA